MIWTREQLENLKASGRLPSPGWGASKELDARPGNGSSAEGLVNRLTQDANLRARIFKVANTIRLANSEQPWEVPSLLASRPPSVIRSAAIALSTLAQNLQGPCPAFQYDRFWSTALASAVAASLLAEASHARDPMEAFAAGLLLDLGYLAVIASIPEEQRQEREGDLPADPTPLATPSNPAASDLLDLSASILREWGLPQELCEAVSQSGVVDYACLTASTEPSRSAALFRAARVLGFALSSSTRTTSLEDQASVLPRSAALAPLKLSPEDQRDFLAVFATRWMEWMALLGLPLEHEIRFDPVVEIFVGRETSGPQGDPAPFAFKGLNPGAIRAISEACSRVLIIDDDERILRLLRHHLERSGYTVHTAARGAEGLALALEVLPQILITDWTMPEMSGIQLCRALNEREAGRRIHKIMLTAREDDELVIAAFDAGVADYIRKPFNPRILVARVRAGERMVRMREQVEHSERTHLKHVAELGILTRKLRMAAMTDPLTDLPNRRFAMTRLKQEWEAVVRSGRELSVSMLDVDHFKRVNDRYGHDTGDLVLRDVAGVLRTHCRQSDVICRLGGEEFLVIHIDTDLVGSCLCAERLREAIEKNETKSESFQGQVTVSLGVASRTPQMRSVDDLLKQADQALYEAKLAGRNRVIARPSRGVEPLSA